MNVEDHFLSEDGISSARKVLCMIGMEHPEVDFLPTIPDLGNALLKIKLIKSVRIAPIHV